MTLQEKIDHARRTSNPKPEALPVSSIRQWVDMRSERTDSWLIYVDDDSNRDSFSYAQFGSMVRSCARALIQAGLQPGDRIATIAHNHWQTVVYYFAAWYAGLTVVPVNITEDDDRIRYVLSHGKVRWAFVLPEYEQRIRGVAPELEVWTGLLQSEADVDFPETYLDMDALIVYTSGTTGHPKGVVLTQANLLEDARAIAQWHGVEPETRMMCVLPIHHVNGTVVTLLTPYYAGASVVLNRKFSASRFFEVIRDEDVHIVSVVPTLLQYLSQSTAAPMDTPLRHIICGAGPLTISVARTFETKYKTRIIHGYGLSETTCYSCYLPLDLTDEEHAGWMRDHGYPSIGTALTVNEMAIHDEQGRPLGDSERGEIVIRGANVMKGYYANDVANENAFTFGWFRSGDEGFAMTDSRGRRFYFITGRIKELIIRGGVNLAPLEIDEVISKAPGVKAGIAVGFENDWYGEEVGAFVQMIEGADHDSEDILEYCRAHLPFAKCPKVVVFGEQIPVTSTGKYQRMNVAHLFSQWKETQFRGGA